MSLRELLDEYKYDEDFIYDGLILDLSHNLKKIMEEKGITKKQLAQRMGVSPAYITKIFRGTNISLKTVAKILAALEVDVRIELKTNKLNKSYDEAMHINYNIEEFFKVDKKIKRENLNENKTFSIAA